MVTKCHEGSFRYGKFFAFEYNSLNIGYFRPSSKLGCPLLMDILKLGLMGNETTLRAFVVMLKVNVRLYFEPQKKEPDKINFIG